MEAFGKRLADRHGKPVRALSSISKMSICNSEAQSNIGKTIEELLKNNRVGMVALEGAFGAMDLTSFRTYPHQDAVKAAADYSPSRTKSRARCMHAADFESGFEFPRVVGIDDAAHYQSNVEAYRSAAPQVFFQVKLRWNREQLALEENKARVFNPALAEFDRHVEAYRQEKISLRNYVQSLFSHENFSPFFCADFCEASQLESSLNFNEVDRERAQLDFSTRRKIKSTRKHARSDELECRSWRNAFSTLNFIPTSKRCAPNTMSVWRNFRYR